MPILTFIDTLGIQSFIFSSNRLKDVVGGSELVSQATSRQGWIEELGYQDNVIVGAGGNLLLQFEDKEQAKTFATKLSRKTLDEAPGLEVALVHHKYDIGQLAQAIQEIQIKIENLKHRAMSFCSAFGLRCHRSVSRVSATCGGTQC